MELGDLMVRLKVISILIGLLVVISACAPIDGLNQEGIGEETTVAMVETTKSQEATTVAAEPVTVAPIQNIEANWVKIKADALNVRKEGSLDAERLTKIYENQIYEVLDRSKDSDGLVWFQVNAADGITGWISSDYCIIAETYDELEEE